MAMTFSQVAKSLHQQTDPWSRRAHHLGQLFMENLAVNAHAARVVLAECTS